MRFRVGMKRTMRKCSRNALPLGGDGAAFLIPKGFAKSVEYVILRLRRRVHHVFGIKAIVAELVRHNLVGGKIHRPVKLLRDMPTGQK